MVSWDEVYKKNGIVQPNTSDSVRSLVPLFKKENANKILDHCCGTGRHTKYLAEQGFHVVGTDSSESGIEIARRVCAALSKVEFKLSDMGEVPYNNNFFDACIAVGSIHQGNKVQREGAFKEISRALKPSGLFFLNVWGNYHESSVKGKPVENDPGSFYVNSDEIPGTMRHYFSEKEIAEKLDGLEILELKRFMREPSKTGFFKFGFYGYNVLARKR